MKSVGIVISTVGYHWEEVYDAYQEFKRVGWHIELYTVDGKAPVADPRSLEERPFLSLFGLGLSKSFNPDTPTGRLLLRDEEFVKPIRDIDTDFDALYIPGGHGALFDVNVNFELHNKIRDFYLGNKILSAVCHGTSALAFVEKEEKESIVYQKRMTGFPELLDDLLVKAGWVHPKFLPIPYSNEKIMREAGAIISPFNFILSLIYPFYHVIDYPFVTGIGPKAAQSVARKVIALAEASPKVVSKTKALRTQLVEF